MPEDLGALAHVVVVAQGLALLRHALLHAVLEVLRLLVALGLQHALQEDLLVLLAGRLVLRARGAQRGVDRLEETVEPAVETLVAVRHYYNCDKDHSKHHWYLWQIASTYAE